MTRQSPEGNEARHGAHLRGFNLERLLTVAIGRPGPFTRAELIEATGLSAPTIGTLTADLIASGLLTDLGTAPSRGGRRPSLMEFNARHGFVSGIDIGPTRTRLAVADLRGVLLAQRIVPTQPERPPTALLAGVAKEVRDLLREARATPSRLLAVGAGLPGAVDRDHGIVVALAPNLEGWSRIPMGAILKRALGAAVVVENDVNLAILGERWKGAARGHDTCAFLSFGTGIGAGILVNGQLHHGHHFLAGEIALMCMGPQYVDTDFGARGCLETLAGRKALSSRWAQASGGETDAGAGALLDAAKAGDTRARRILDDTATLIAIAAANLSVVVDPSLIVLGGALIADVPTLVQDVRRIVARIVPMPATIVATELDKEAPLWGSVLVATTEAHELLRRQLRDGRVA